MLSNKHTKPPYTQLVLRSPCSMAGACDGYEDESVEPRTRRSCIDGNAPGLHLLPLRALGGFCFLCREGVVVQMSVSRCCAVQFVQSLEKEKMVTSPAPLRARRVRSALSRSCWSDRFKLVTACGLFCAPTLDCVKCPTGRRIKITSSLISQNVSAMGGASSSFIKSRTTWSMSKGFIFL